MASSIFPSKSLVPEESLECLAPSWSAVGISSQPFLKEGKRGEGYTPSP